MRHMEINRYINLEDKLIAGKVLLIYGPRRTGKTTLLDNLMRTTKLKYLFYRGDDINAQNIFSVPDSQKLTSVIGRSELLVLDEAQMIPGIGKTLKLLVDSMPELKIVVSGSASFELAGQVGEPLTGRKYTHYLFPISIEEDIGHQPSPYAAFHEKLENYMLYGTYPSVLTKIGDTEKKHELREIVNSYLLKDILALQEVKSSQFIMQLLAMLAYQVGGVVSMSELASGLGVNKLTVARYIDLLEKSFIIFRLSGLSRNLRSEIKKSDKFFFYDNGIRNAIIDNFNPLAFRNDVGQLWENFVIVERNKKRLYYGPSANQYFWRTWKGSEIDLVEERAGKYFGYEAKWNSKKAVSAPDEWLETYNDQAEWQLVTPENFLPFVGLL